MNQHKINQFARGTTVALPPIVRDIMGRPLKEGDRIILNPVAPPPWGITKIVPVLTGPANMMDITITCTLKFRAVRDQVNQEFIRVQSVEEIKAMAGEQEPPADPPPDDAPPDEGKPRLIVPGEN